MITGSVQSADSAQHQHKKRVVVTRTVKLVFWPLPQYFLCNERLRVWVENGARDAGRDEYALSCSKILYRSTCVLKSDTFCMLSGLILAGPAS